MVDYFALALTHGLLVLAGWRLLWRDDLDRDPDPADAGDPDQTGAQAGSGPADGAIGRGLRIRA